MKKIFFIVAFVAASITINAQNNPFGIGTSNPQSQLHIHQTVEVEDPIPPILPPYGNGNRDGIFYDNYATTLQMTNVNTGSNSSDGFLLEQYNRDVFFLQRENGHMVFQTPGGKMILSSTGRFGYGDTISTHRFNVNGTARFSSDVKMVQALNVDGTVTTGGVLNVGGALNTAGHLTVGSANQPPVGLTVHGATTLNYGLTVTNATTLNGALHVNSSTVLSGVTTINGATTINNTLRVGNGFFCDAGGGLKVKYLKVTLTDWPDYVFSGNHTLMPLGELEAYVNEHSHLPGVPTAEEIEENGADLGEMNKVLMEKVEELTLYIIDLQKQINEMKSNK